MVWPFSNISANSLTFLPSKGGVHLPSPWIKLCDSLNRIQEKSHCEFLSSGFMKLTSRLCLLKPRRHAVRKSKQHLWKSAGWGPHGHQWPAQTCQPCEGALWKVDPPAPSRATYFKLCGAKGSWPHPNFRFVSKINDDCYFKSPCFRVFYYATMGRH